MGNDRRSGIVRLWPLLVAALLVIGCATTRTTSGGTVGVDREQTMLVSSTEVNRSAVKAYQQTLRDAQRRGLLNRDADEVARVRQVARRLIPVTVVFRSDAPGWNWEVNVLTSKELNAWCMPGGKIMVYGHSSSYPWDISPYTKIFRQVNKLKTGDDVYVTYQGQLYHYTVTDQQQIAPTDNSPFVGSGEELLLYTCWPPDSTKSRLVIHAAPVQTVAVR